MKRREFFSFLGLAPIAVVAGTIEPKTEDDLVKVSKTHHCAGCGSNLYHKFGCAWCGKPWTGKPNETA